VLLSAAAVRSQRRDTLSALIVPYRGRPGQLQHFLRYMRRYLGIVSSWPTEIAAAARGGSISGFDGMSKTRGRGGGRPAVAIIVVEQDNSSPFNRGWLINVGAHLATKNSNELRGTHGVSWPASGLIFHDVDILPSSQLDAFYSTQPLPNVGYQMVNPRWESGPPLIYAYFGGANAFNADDFMAMNGYPNDRDGWGLEDDCLRQRAALLNPPIEIWRPRTGAISFLPHKSNYDTTVLQRTLSILEEDAVTWRQNGLNTLRYAINDVSEVSPAVYHVKVTSLLTSA